MKWQVVPFPFVPATWMILNRFSGLPAKAASGYILSRE